MTAPMDPARAATEALETALGTVPGLRVTQLGQTVDPPAAIVGPPRLTYETGCLDPTEGFFPVFIVVAADDRWRDRLWELVPQAVAAIDEYVDASVLAANPGTFRTGQTELPSYQLDVEVAL